MSYKPTISLPIGDYVETPGGIGLLLSSFFMIYHIVNSVHGPQVTTGGILVKKRVNVSLDPELHILAKEYKLNLSGEFNEFLKFRVNGHNIKEEILAAKETVRNLEYILEFRRKAEQKDNQLYEVWKKTRGAMPSRAARGDINWLMMWQPDFGNHENTEILLKKFKERYAQEVKDNGINRL